MEILNGKSYQLFGSEAGLLSDCTILYAFQIDVDLWEGSCGSHSPMLLLLQFLGYKSPHNSSGYIPGIKDTFPKVNV